MKRIKPNLELSGAGGKSGLIPRHEGQPSFFFCLPPRRGLGFSSQGKGETIKESKLKSGFGAGVEHRRGGSDGRRRVSVAPVESNRAGVTALIDGRRGKLNGKSQRDAG
jgi:hypothetical protein